MYTAVGTDRIRMWPLKIVYQKNNKTETACIWFKLTLYYAELVDLKYVAMYNAINF